MNPVLSSDDSPPSLQASLKQESENPAIILSFTFHFFSYAILFLLSRPSTGRGLLWWFESSLKFVRVVHHQSLNDKVPNFPSFGRATFNGSPRPWLVTFSSSTSEHFLTFFHFSWSGITVVVMPKILSLRMCISTRTWDNIEYSYIAVRKIFRTNSTTKEYDYSILSQVRTIILYYLKYV